MFLASRLCDAWAGLVGLVTTCDMKARSAMLAGRASIDGLEPEIFPDIILQLLLPHHGYWLNRRKTDFDMPPASRDLREPSLAERTYFDLKLVLEAIA